MQISFLPDDGTGRAVLRAVPDTGDTHPPVDALIIDAAPRERDADLVAAAGTLLFSRYAGSSLEFTAPISADLATAIQEGTGLSIRSLVDRATDHAPTLEEITAPQVTDLEISFAGPVPQATPSVDLARLGLIPGERFQGALFGVKEALIASNAWYLASVVDPVDVQHAAGFLFSREFLSRKVTALSTDGEAAPAAELTRILGTSIGLVVS